MNFKTTASLNSVYASTAVAASVDKVDALTVFSYARDTERRASFWQKETLSFIFSDANHDNVITPQEVRQYRAERDRNFAVIDTDGDGRMSFREELQWALDTGKVDKATVEKFLRMDSDRDGKISNQEARDERLRSKLTRPI